jgi:hypothetical protein
VTGQVAQILLARASSAAMLWSRFRFNLLTGYITPYWPAQAACSIQRRSARVCCWLTTEGVLRSSGMVAFA